MARSLWSKHPKKKIVVISKIQKKGRGRKGRKWESSSGGIYLSIVFSLPHRRYMQLLTFITASAVCTSIHSLFHVKPGIKWPNDILIKGKKVGGILIESVMGKEVTVIIGVGINLNQKSFPYGLRTKATSIFLQTKKKCNQKEFERLFLNSFMKYYKNYCIKEFHSIIEEWKKWDVTKGSKVVVRTPKGEEAGVVEGVTTEGSLVIKTKSNKLLTFHEGEVHIHRFKGKTFKK